MSLTQIAHQKLALALELAINRVLALDSSHRETLKALNGATVEVALTDIGLVLYFSSEEDGLTVHTSPEAAPDASLRGSLSGFLAMRISPDPKPVFSSGALTMEGDTHVARQFQRLLGAAGIDWEGVLASITGELFAAGTGQALRDTRLYVRQTGGDLLQNLSEYLRYERHWLPLRSDVQSWLNGVDRLRDDIARLEQRIARAESRRNG
ncbi:MAG: SCP2 sterol-binding domain-containing protein [Gammaproteobacteria bacterium]|nr:SCP2 sterol-binding domain-containing protein [Gammaproteobacteria bacterium]